MKAYYKQGWGISFIVLGLVLLVLNFMLINMGKSNPMGLVLGIFITFMGAMYLSRAALELRANELVMFNLFGMEIKRYPFDKLSDFQIVDGKIYLSTNGQSKRVRISRAMIRTADWDLLMRKLTGEDITRELHTI